jgi:ammonia channel protein AmtB
VNRREESGHRRNWPQSVSVICFVASLVAVATGLVTERVLAPQWSKDAWYAVYGGVASLVLACVGTIAGLVAVASAARGRAPVASPVAALVANAGLVTFYLWLVS